ncbi:MAG: diguanylate cyclase [Gammaproteobacteria bacterium]|nr:MAG: diguanylate cyclase [Gammaproteobacteria bacterium]
MKPTRGGRCCISLWGAVVAAVLGCANAHALDPARTIRQLPHVWYENQLPQSTVLSIAQRNDGSIWLATYAGLARYSGAAFDSIDRRTAPVLRSSAITSLLVDRDGTFWVGTLNGGLYKSRGRTFEEVPASGALWLATDLGIARRDASGVHIFGTDSGMPRGTYRGLAADADGNVWIAVDGAGVARWHGGKFELYGVAQGVPNAAVYAVRIDHAGVLWAGTQGGLAYFHDGRFERDPKAAALEGKRVYALQGDRDDNLWMSVLGLGICRLNARSFDCERGLAGLGNQVVRSMFEDLEGNLWIGTTDGGAHRISDSKLATVTGAGESNSVRAVWEDAQGTIWGATDGSGLVLVEPHALTRSKYNVGLISPFTRSIASDATGNLWVGSIEGLSRIAPDGQVRNFRVADGLPAGIVFSIAARKDGGVWAGTQRGLARVSRDDKVELITETRNDDIRALYEAPDGQLHCLHAGVLDTCGTDGLNDASVFAFHPTADGSLWLGTSQGIMRWRAGRLQRYGESVGLYGDAVFAILDDDAGNFWISSNRGIARIARSDFDALDRGEMQHVEMAWYGKSDGMLTAQGNGASQSPGARARDGRLWFGTANGVVLVDPAHQRRNLAPPPVAIESMQVDGKDVDPTNAGKLEPGVDKVEFHYAGMSYVAPEAVRYRYRLEGYDRDWVEAGDRRAAYYTNLPPGDYVFHAKACNNDGVWNEAGAEAAFTIKPRIFETASFRVLVAFAAIGTLFGMYRLRLWRVRENERALTREVAVRTEALRAANEELRRLSSLDGLTHIANRGAFDERLIRTWDDHRARGASLAVLLCDIDSFKAYNDTYGHLAGDATLASVAGTLASVARSPADLAARYGGEEFALLLANCKAPEAAVVAQRLLDTVRALGIEHRESGVVPVVTISIGVAVHVPNGNSPEELVRRADQALYRAKAEGRNRVCGPDELQ